MPPSHTELLLSQSLDGVHAGGTAGRYETREQRRDYEDWNHDGEGHRLTRLHSFHQAHQDAPRRPGTRASYANSQENYSKALSHHQPHHIPSIRSQRHAYAEFRHALT